MKQRININTAQPQALKAMMGLEAYLAQTSIPKNIKELIKICASQINHCAYCIDMHTKDALKNGETTQRIFLLNAWREATGMFSEAEMAALAVTEEVTLIHDKGLTDATYEKALESFTENEVAELLMAVITINAWNRIAISGHFKVGKE